MPKTLLLRAVKKINKFFDENSKVENAPDKFGKGAFGDRARAAERRRQKVIDRNKSIRHKGDK